MESYILLQHLQGLKSVSVTGLERRILRASLTGVSACVCAAFSSSAIRKSAPATRCSTLNCAFFYGGFGSWTHTATRASMIEKPHAIA